MANFLIWRTVEPQAGFPGFERYKEYRYNSATDVLTEGPWVDMIAAGAFSPYHPPAGTVLFTECSGPAEQRRIIGTGGFTSVTITFLEDYAPCCDVNISGFAINKTNNTDLGTPNGTITIDKSDINLYEVSIDGGDTFETESGGIITFSDLPAGTYPILIRLIDSVCSVSTSINIIDNITYPPLIIEPVYVPGDISPVFYPIEYKFRLQNNEASIKEDVSGVYLEVASSDAKDYLLTLPIIKIVGNPDYNGVYKITSVDDVDTPTKFYFNGTYISDQDANFVPFGRQTFELYAEVVLNGFEKIADIAVSENTEGEYIVRVEAFLQSVYNVGVPVNNGEELTLSRKYYLLPVEFELIDPPQVLLSVYSAIPSLTPFINDLVPLGPVPINFINEQTQKGLPVLFSYIDADLNRVVNITSSQETEIFTNQSLVYIPALPLNTYHLEWLKGSEVETLTVDPALPSWITVENLATDRVTLTIETFTSEGGDYTPEDYLSDDYLTNGINAIVGCYEYVFSDDSGELFTLSICVYPVQQANKVCGNLLNIAWVNRQGGWSSYVFDQSKTFTKQIGIVKDFKRSGELRKSSVEEVYDGVRVTYAVKSQREVDFISELRQSIQAFLYNDSTQQWDIPIFIEKANFDKYRVPFKSVDQENSFSFLYSNEILIQKQ